MSLNGKDEREQQLLAFDSPSVVELALREGEETKYLRRLKSRDLEIQESSPLAASVAAYEMGHLYEHYFLNDALASKAYRRSLGFNSSFHANLWSVRNLFHRRGLWQQAIKLALAERENSHKPSRRAGVDLEVGHIYEFELGQTEKAKTYYESAVNEKTDFILGWMILRRIAIAEGDTERAVECSERLLALSLSDELAQAFRYFLTVEASKRGDWDRVAHYSKVGVNGSIGREWFAKKLILAGIHCSDVDFQIAGLFPLASAQERDGLELTGTCGAAWFQIAMLRESENPELAWQAIEKARNILPNDPIVSMAQARLAAATGRDTDVSAALDKRLAKGSSVEDKLLVIAQTAGTFRRSNSHRQMADLSYREELAPGSTLHASLLELQLINASNLSGLAELYESMGERSAEGNIHGKSSASSPSEPLMAAWHLIAASAVYHSFAEQSQRAKNCLVRAQELAPSWEEPVEALANLLLENNDIDGAINQWGNYLGRSQGTSHAFAATRLLDLDLGYKSVFACDALRVIAERDGNERDYFLWAHASFLHGKYEDSIRAWEARAALAKSNNLRGEYLARAGRIAMVQLGDLELAGRLFAESLAAVPDHSLARFSFSLTLAAREKWEDLVSFLREEGRKHGKPWTYWAIDTALSHGMRLDASALLLGVIESDPADVDAVWWWLRNADYDSDTLHQVTERVRSVSGTRHAKYLLAHYLQEDRPSSALDLLGPPGGPQTCELQIKLAAESRDFTSFAEAAITLGEFSPRLLASIQTQIAVLSLLEDTPIDTENQSLSPTAAMVGFWSATKKGDLVQSFSLLRKLGALAADENDDALSEYVEARGLALAFRSGDVSMLSEIVADVLERGSEKLVGLAVEASRCIGLGETATSESVRERSIIRAAIFRRAHGLTGNPDWLVAAVDMHLQSGETRAAEEISTELLTSCELTLSVLLCIYRTACQSGNSTLISAIAGKLSQSELSQEARASVLNDAFELVRTIDDQDSASILPLLARLVKLNPTTENARQLVAYCQKIGDETTLHWAAQVFDESVGAKDEKSDVEWREFGDELDAWERTFDVATSGGHRFRRATGDELLPSEAAPQDSYYDAIVLDDDEIPTAPPIPVEREHSKNIVRRETLSDEPKSKELLPSFPSLQSSLESMAQGFGGRRSSETVAVLLKNLQGEHIYRELGYLRELAGDYAAAANLYDLDPHADENQRWIRYGSGDVEGYRQLLDEQVIASHPYRIFASDEPTHHYLSLKNPFLELECLAGEESWSLLLEKLRLLEQGNHFSELADTLEVRRGEFSDKSRVDYFWFHPSEGELLAISDESSLPLTTEEAFSKASVLETQGQYEKAAAILESSWDQNRDAPNYFLFWSKDLYAKERKISGTARCLIKLLDTPFRQAALYQLEKGLETSKDQQARADLYSHCLDTQGPDDWIAASCAAIANSFVSASQILSVAAALEWLDHRLDEVEHEKVRHEINWLKEGYSKPEVACRSSRETALLAEAREKIEHGEIESAIESISQDKAEGIGPRTFAIAAASLAVGNRAVRISELLDITFKESHSDREAERALFRSHALRGQGVSSRAHLESLSSEFLRSLYLAYFSDNEETSEFPVLELVASLAKMKLKSEEVWELLEEYPKSPVIGLYAQTFANVTGDYALQLRLANDQLERLAVGDVHHMVEGLVQLADVLQREDNLSHSVSALQEAMTLSPSTFLLSRIQDVERRWEHFNFGTDSRDSFLLAASTCLPHTFTGELSWFEADDPLRRWILGIMQVETPKSDAEKFLGLAEWFSEDKLSEAAFTNRAGECLVRCREVDEAIVLFKRADKIASPYVTAVDNWLDVALSNQLWVELAEACRVRADSMTSEKQKAAVYHLGGVALMDKAIAARQAVTFLSKSLMLDPYAKDQLLRITALQREQADFLGFADSVEIYADYQDNQLKNLLLDELAEVYANQLSLPDKSHEILLTLSNEDIDERAICQRRFEASMEMEDFRAAASDLQDWIVAEEDSRKKVDLYNALAELYFEKLNDADSGSATLETIVELDPSNKVAWEELAKRSFDSGAYTRCREASIACLDLTSNSQQRGLLYELAGLGFEKEGEVARAIQCIAMSIGTAPERDGVLVRAREVFKRNGTDGDPHFLHAAAKVRAKLSDDLQPTLLDCYSSILREVQCLKYSGPIDAALELAALVRMEDSPVRKDRYVEHERFFSFDDYCFEDPRIFSVLQVFQCIEKHAVKLVGKQIQSRVSRSKITSDRLLQHAQHLFPEINVFKVDGQEINARMYWSGSFWIGIKPTLLTESDETIIASIGSLKFLKSLILPAFLQSTYAQRMKVWGALLPLDSSLDNFVVEGRKIQMKMDKSHDELKRVRAGVALTYGRCSQQDIDTLEMGLNVARKRIALAVSCSVKGTICRNTTIQKVKKSDEWDDIAKLAVSESYLKLFL